MRNVLVFRYNGTIEEFTVPAGGAGLYFFYTIFFAENQEIAHFLIRINDQPICQAGSDMDSSGTNDNGTPSCAALATLVEGIEHVPTLNKSRVGVAQHKFRSQHRSDSIQGTDYIDNYFFLNLKVSRAKIENPK